MLEKIILSIHTYSVELSYFGHYTLIPKLLKWNYSSTKASPFQNFFLLNIEHFNQQAQIERKKNPIYPTVTMRLNR